MRMRLVFLYGDSKYDVPNCKYAWQNSGSKHSLSFRLCFVTGTKIISRCNFTAPLIDPKRLRIRLNKIDGFIRNYDGTSI